MNPAVALRHLREVTRTDSPNPAPVPLQRFREILHMTPGSPDGFARCLPFSPADTTAGSECELQTSVAGPREFVDLPRYIRESNYYKNILKKAQSGDAPRQVVTSLEEFLDNQPDAIWENSWIRLPQNRLNPFACQVFQRDLRGDKRQPDGPTRCDAEQFFFTEAGVPFLRLPMSYVLKLALAEAVGDSGTDPFIHGIGVRLMEHFLSDNTSPETYSFHPVPMDAAHGGGKGIAGETLMRFLLCQLLTQFANRRFDLKTHGQKAQIYFAPHPPVRQKLLNDLISDAFYRELFMSPCLSGWNRGEEKHRYMHLCHQVLSRSQLNAAAKLREAGIVTSNLFVMPNTSNVSLANNGVHISLGSRLLTGLLGDPASGLSAADEKYYGDLVIKIVEHFLPLFVGSYSAAPYRFDYWEFHPEKVLGFLPHELDFTHLRMIWRRWKKKAAIKIFGKPVTPFGPEWIDRLISRLFFLQGDYVCDFRVLDYMVSVLSTEQSPALDGSLATDGNLKKDLAALGIFDTAMPLYLLYRLRRFGQMGFSGFEGRHYSLFHSLQRDLSRAADLQLLATALAFKYVLSGTWTHKDIPDDPFTESERRQIFFGRAIGIPTFFIRDRTPNRLMRRIVAGSAHTRASRRYPGYTRVHNRSYQQALVRTIREDAPDLIEMMKLETAMEDLEERVTNPDTASAAGRLTRAILDTAGAYSPMSLPGSAFNPAAERYYRETLKKHHLTEALEHFAAELRRLDDWETWRRGRFNKPMLWVLNGKSAPHFLKRVARDVVDETASEKTLLTLIHLVLLTVEMGAERCGAGRRSVS